MNNAINGNVLEKYVQQRNYLQQQLEKLIYNKNRNDSVAQKNMKYYT